jgi:tetratricopeptide (TPR) repeat protein
MRVTAALALILLAAPAAAQQNERYTEPTEAIVVTGIRIQDYRDRLAACLARNCPPNEDADATLALAEALFLNGDYAEGRQAVHASLRRNRDEARGYPEPVSDLYRAHSRLSRHLGFDREALRSTHGILDSLQEGLPREDHRHFTARFELADMQMMMGRLGAARRELDRLAEIARAAGREDVAIRAELRTLWFNYLSDRNGVTRSRLIDMAGSTDPAQRFRSVGARILLSRIYRMEGNDARADALIAEIGRGTSAQRRLLFSPRYQLLQQDPNAGGDEDIADTLQSQNTLRRLPENYVDKWIDVGFWVQPDGSVEGLEILRRGAGAGWADPLLESIRGRRYSTGEEPTYRLERYTFTAGWEIVTGSRIRQRGPGARVEYLDLTVSNPPPPPAAPQTRQN